MKLPAIAAALLLAARGEAIELQGRVVAVTGTDVRVAVEGDLLPRAGDAVTLAFQIPGGPRVKVGTWKVTGTEGDHALATVVEATGAPALDQLATIQSADPVPRAQAVPSGTTRIRHRGQTFSTRHQAQLVASGPIDVFFFETPGGPVVDGQRLYNRFVREPAEGQPGPPTWWFCEWVMKDGRWQYVQATITDVGIERAPIDLRAWEGSTWSSQSIEVRGDRSGQSFSSEYHLTTAGGLTRLRAPEAYAEGRWEGSRLVFTTHRPDGSAVVGEGWATFSGETFSGVWTATNGRAGTFEGRRIR